MTVVELGGVEFYIDGKLRKQLDKVKKKVEQKDEDFFFSVDGGEGSGKSVLTMQLAKYLDPTFCLDRLVFDPNQFREAIINAKKGQAVVFDEAFRGLSSRGALTEINKLLVALMMECRQKNLYVFVVMPSFFLLDKYVALWRAKGLFHVYRRQGKRGFWVFFNQKKKKILYLKGKATYSYDQPRSTFRGRFLNQYTIDEKEYREKKKKALLSIEKSLSTKKISLERDLLYWYLNRNEEKSIPQIKQHLEDLGVKIGKSTIGDAIKRAEKRLKSKGVIA